MSNITSIIDLNTVGFQKHVATLTESQQQFITLLQDWIAKPRNMVVIVSGGPGTGKTYTVIETFNFIQCPQLRMAPTARIAQKIGGKTLHSALRIDWTEGSVLKKLEKQLEHETDMFTCIEVSNELRESMFLKGSFNIVVIDEIGMIPFWFAIQVFKYLFERREDDQSPILIVTMGDKHQLRPVRSNENLFDIPSLRDRFETHMIELTESKRFEPSYEVVVRKLCTFVDGGNVDEMFEYVQETFPIVQEIDSDLLMKCKRALAFRNSTVNNYNAFYLKYLIPGKIIRLFTHIDNKIDRKNPIDVKQNCLVFVTKNGCAENVNNGTPLYFNRYDAEKDVIVCDTLNKCKKVEIYRDRNGQFPIVVGFAGTVHKYQGDTIDEDGIVINFDGSRDLNLVYTALSRVKSMKQLLAVAL